MDYAKVLNDAYQQFLLDLGGKKVPTPYRRNEFGNYQKIGPEFQGKSSPEVLIKTTEKLAIEQKFDLNKASVEEIREFMRKNKLGIDCSGFAYRLLDELVKEVKGKPLTSFGLPHVGRTYLSTLVSEEFAVPVKSFNEAKPGDLIDLDNEAKTKNRLLHGLVILSNENGKVIYAHSSSLTIPDGAHTDEIINGQFPEDLKIFSYNEGEGDGIYRLKIL